MLFIIGGSPGSGKSYLAKELTKHRYIQIIEVDLLMPSFNALIPRTEHLQKLPVWQAKKENRDPKPEDYLTEAETYWPAIRSLLNFLIKNRFEEDFVIEGAQVFPKYLKDWLDTLHGKEVNQVKVIFLVEDKTKLDSLIKEQAVSASLPISNRKNALALFA